MIYIIITLIDLSWSEHGVLYVQVNNIESGEAKINIGVEHP